MVVSLASRGYPANTRLRLALSGTSLGGYTLRPSPKRISITPLVTEGLAICCPANSGFCPRRLWLANHSELSTL